MKKRKEILDFFQIELAPDLAKLELERKKIAKKLLAVGLVLAIIFFAIILYSFDWEVAFFSLFICCSMFFFVKNFISKKYVIRFKEKIIKKIVAFIDPTLTYSASSSVSEQLFTESQIFRRSADVFKGDDHVSGQVGSTKIEFSELFVQYITRTSKGRKHKSTLFKGLFFSADFNKHFSGKTFVLPDVSEKMLGRVGTMIQELNNHYGELIKLEDVEFEKMFAVYADDQIEARYILSPALMERIKNIQKRTKKRISLSFVGSKVNIAIPYSEDLFEPTIFRTIKDFKSIRDYFEDLMMMIELVEDLNLNTRIWTKH